MQSLEQSCRMASEFFTGMADRVSIKENKKFYYEMSLDMYAAATWIENMRKVEFYFAQMFPEEYRECLRKMQEDTEKEFKYE